MNDTADFQQVTLSAHQRGMLKLLGDPPIIAAQWSGKYWVSEAVENPHPMLQPPYYVTYLCPVVELLGVPRAIRENGDIHEIAFIKLEPVPEHWSSDDGCT